MVVKVVAQINTNWISLSFGQLSVAPEGPIALLCLTLLRERQGAGAPAGERSAEASR